MHAEELSFDWLTGPGAIQMGQERTGGLLGAVYLLVGATLLASALFVPWYTYDSYYVQNWRTPSGGGSAEVGPSELNFFLFGLPGRESVQSSCPSGNITGFCPTSSSYSAAGLSSTGVVATLTLGLATAGFAAAFISGILAVRPLRGPRRGFPELTIALSAVALAVAAVTAYPVLLPRAFAHDVPASVRSLYPAGPWSSFAGSTTFYIVFPCPYPGCPPRIASWGPSIGWCFSLAGIAVVLVGAILITRFRRHVAYLVPPHDDESD